MEAEGREPSGVQLTVDSDARARRGGRRSEMEAEGREPSGEARSSEFGVRRSEMEAEGREPSGVQLTLTVDRSVTRERGGGVGDRRWEIGTR